MRQIGQLWHMYANDNHLSFPDNAQGYGTWELIDDWQKTNFVDKYKFRNGKVFYCPSFIGWTGGAFSDEDAVNAALREYVEGKAPKIEDTLRRILREELGKKPSAA